MFTSVHTSSHLFTPIHTRSHLFTPVHNCSHLFTLVHTCSQLFTTVLNCSHLFTLQWLSTLFAHCSFSLNFPLAKAVIFRSYVLSCWNCKPCIIPRTFNCFPKVYGLLIPLEAHHKAQSRDIFLSFHAKTQNSCTFLSFGQPCWNCIFKLPRSRAFDKRMTCPSAAKKSCGSHLFGVGPGKVDKTGSVQELSKAITFLSYVLSRWNFTFELG